MRRYLFALLLFVVAPVGARELRWESVEVAARLAADGSLHVTERQTLVFTGDWNGGERRFTVGEGQRLRVAGMRRIDASGAAVSLSRGNLTAVDRYLFGDNVLRWRSRDASAPPFDGTALTYEIDFVYQGILLISGGGGRRYLLDHDFAFADRPGPIQRFVLELALDPVWQAAGVPERFTAGPLLPGESFVVRRDLTYAGTAGPPAARAIASPFVRHVTVALLLLGFPALFARFWLAERRRGRFAREAPAIDAAWLEEHVLGQPPEVIGYMLDGKSGAPEVAAIVARLTQEGKIATGTEPRWLRSPLLKMTLLADRHDFDGAERLLVDAFFAAGETETDTARIRQRYRRSGFDPGGRIGPLLAAQAARLPSWRDEPAAAERRLQRRTLAVAFGLLVTAAPFGFSSLWLAIFMAVLGGIACAIGRAIARRSADKLRGLPLRWVAASVPPLLVGWLLAFIAGREVSRVQGYPLLIAALFVLAVYWFVLEGARSEQSAEKTLLRARLLAARRWLLQELRGREPRLRDEWAPYLIALGLGRDVDRWFAAFGGEGAGSLGTTAASRAGVSTSSAASSHASAGGWSGGGGAFGGAGAGGSWAAAATALGSGVSAAASSGSGGSRSSGGGSSSGGSSSSSSSGGGGGGGW